MRKRLRPTLETVAELCGYSASTVSRALAGSTRISPETRRKVIRCADRCAYRPECKNIAVISGGTENYFSFMLNALQRELFRSGFRAFVLAPGMLELLEEFPVRGAVSLLSENGLEQYWGTAHTWPLVCVNTRPNRLERLFSVSCDDAGAIAAAAEELYRAGHRRIGKIGLEHTPVNLNASRRDLAFRELSERLPFAAFSEEVPFNRPHETALALRRLLDRKVTALISASETVTPLLAQAAQLLRVRIPGELSVVAWSTGEADGFFPEWETFRQDYDAIARAAVRTLQILFDGGIPEEADRKIPYLFHAGSSVAPPREWDDDSRGG